MKRTIWYLALAIAALPCAATAADWGVNSTTLFRFEEKALPGFSKQTVVPATEFLGADLDKLADGNLSFHLYSWGRVDLADKSTNEKDTDGDLAYAYVSYRFPKANGELKAGRFSINEGVAVEQIDGVSARADLQKGFTLSMYGGRPVHLDWNNNNKGEYILGGRGSWRWKGILEVGVSGLQEGNAPLALGTGKDDRQLVGGDIWLSPIRAAELAGHTSYNAATGGVAEHSYLLTVRPHKLVTVTGSFNEQHFKNYFTYSSIRSLFNPNNGGELKSYGLGVTVVPITLLEATVDYRHFDRSSDVSTDSNGSSNRYGVEARVTMLDKKLRAGAAYHRADGASNFNSYDELRGFCLYDVSRYVGSVDVIGQFYKNSISTKKEAFELIASAGYRILPELALSGDISYGQNPQFNDELRGVLRLTYNYNSAAASKGAKK
jgi:hypothetical protein